MAIFFSVVSLVSVGCTAEGQGNGVRPAYTLDGHDGRINKVVFSPDGRYLASGGTDGRVMIWSTADGSRKANLDAHSHSVWSVAFVDNDTLASGGEDTQVHLWSVSTGRRSQSMRWHTRAVVSMVYDRAGGHLVTAARDNTAKVWAPDTGNEIGCIKAGAAVSDVAVSPDGQRIATVGIDYEIRFWTLSGAPLSPPMPRQHSGTYSLSFSPDGKIVATAGTDGFIRLWSSEDGRLVNEFAGHASGCWSLSWSPDGRKLATGGHDRTLRMWDVASGKLLASVPHSRTVSSVAFSPDGQRLAAACFDGYVRLWDVPALERSAVSR